MLLVFVTSVCVKMVLLVWVCRLMGSVNLRGVKGSLPCWLCSFSCSFVNALANCSLLGLEGYGSTFCV